MLFIKCSPWTTLRARPLCVLSCLRLLILGRRNLKLGEIPHIPKEGRLFCLVREGGAVIYSPAIPLTALRSPGCPSGVEQLPGESSLIPSSKAPCGNFCPGWVIPETQSLGPELKSKTTHTRKVPDGKQAPPKCSKNSPLFN